VKNKITGLLCCLLLAGCHSGGGGDDRTSPSSVQVTLTSPSLSIDLAAGDEIPSNVDGSWSGTSVQPSNVYLHARDTAGRFATPASKSGSSGSTFSFTLYTQPGVAAGTHSGTIEVRACRDPNCMDPYPGASATVDYTLNVAVVTDWETHQRDAAHRGYVPIWLNPSRFAKAWEWSREFDGEPIGGINAVVTRSGRVYVTKDVYFGQGVLYALNESSGTEVWRVSFGQVPALNPPAISDGRVFAAVTGHEDTFLWAFDANTGTYLHKSAFEGQWPHILAPTVYGDRVYTGGGYYGGMTYSFATADGSRTWEYNAGGVWDMFTPAVDDTYVYHHNGSALYLINRSTGTTAAIIGDPFGSTFGYSYHGAPMIGGRNNVISFAGGTFSGRASSNVEQYDQRVLSSFNINTGSYEWSTPYAYLTVPAVANGVIYAARNTSMSLDAIDETTGQVLWSWVPTGNGDTSFHRNIVLTRNILFVSTDRAVYALDLATRTPVWSYPKPGMLAISADRTLYIATGARESDGRLVAVKMK
jgi:outer membrane protein assembly factor BamB